MGSLAVLALMPAKSRAAPRSRDRIMVQGRPQDTGSLYKVRNIIPALDQLGGVRKMRCRDPYSGTPGWNTYVGLAREGVTFCFTLSVRDIARTLSDLRAFLAAAPSSIWAIEFPNEPDLNPVTYKGTKDARLGFRTGNAPAFMAYIGDMATALRSDPILSAIPLIASNDYMQAEQKPYTDFGNTHIYPRPATNVEDRLDVLDRRLAGAGQSHCVITEWGRTTGGGEGNVTSPPVSLEDQRRLLAKDVASVLSRPTVHVLNIYELFSWGGSSEMNNFGLFNADLSPRPAAVALRSLLT
ncbi:hypothetical protein SAMN06296065_102445 [Novosphingobium panipatense]|uniref:Calcium-binding protein n=2 Tax=Novosphingobium panipatense TaxID=428991 RepID=A0ABY1Q5B5_9SPHN|nr:hypothetical protein SAMN06296065_102445 [Novosphingobium panipatense]